MSEVAEVIEFRSVSKTYPGAGNAAVDTFSYTVSEGETTVFVGPSGCGKTTLLRMVNRMVEPTAGQVLVRGRDVANADPVELRRSIGYVMQHSGLMPHRTALDNVADIARLAGASKKSARERALEMLELVNLDPALADRYPGELSGGQAQRVGVARGLVNSPDIIMMDEPFAAVDPVVRRKLQDEILGIRDRLRTTVLMVTHDIDEAFKMGDHIVVLGERAAVEQAGSPEDIMAHPASARVRDFIGLDGRELTVVKRGDANVLVDGSGTVKGVLA